MASGAGSLSSGFDVDAYASRYQGSALIHRLAFIGQQASADPAVRRKATEYALNGVKDLAADAGTYTRLAGIAEGPHGFDASLAETMRRNTSNKLAILEKEVNISRANALKDATRNNYLELAQAQKEAGLFTEAIRSLQFGREFASNARQLCDNSMVIVDCGILAGSFPIVAAHVTRPDVLNELSNPVIAAKVHAAQGLVSLNEGTLDRAAREFFCVPATLAAPSTLLVHPEEAAMYAAVCALASFSREDLRTEVLANPGARQVLENHPLFKEILENFVSAKYAKALEALQQAEGDLRLDVFLAPHVDTVVRRIRTRAMQQYLLPYSTVDLRSMATAFDLSVPALEDEVVTLITRGAISAKIDSDLKLLYSHKADQRAAALRSITETGRVFAEEVKTILLNASIERAGLVPSIGGGDRRGGMLA